MDYVETQVPEQDQIKVTVNPDGVIKAGLAYPEDVIKVEVLAVGPEGPPGPAGDEGPPGPPGPPGDSESAFSYVHYQMTPDDTWVIAHHLNFKPGGILVQDAAGTTYEGEIEHLDENNLRLTFHAGFSGTAYLS